MIFNKKYQLDIWYNSDIAFIRRIIRINTNKQINNELKLD